MPGGVGLGLIGEYAARWAACGPFSGDLRAVEHRRGDRPRRIQLSSFTNRRSAHVLGPQLGRDRPETKTQRSIDAGPIVGLVERELTDAEVVAAVKAVKEAAALLRRSAPTRACRAARRVASPAMVVALVSFWSALVTLGWLPAPASTSTSTVATCARAPAQRELSPVGRPGRAAAPGVPR